PPVLHLENASEPFWVEWPPTTGECDMLVFTFHGGLMPYSLYFAVSHATDNQTWSEERFIAYASIISFQVYITPGIGFDSAGAEDIACSYFCSIISPYTVAYLSYIGIPVTAQSSQECSINDSSMITIEQPSTQESDQ
ncbi:15000_t:CDS:2, partial [Acaulospora colombiana]